MGAGKRQNEGEENLELQFRLLSSYRSFPKFCMEIYLQGILAGRYTQKAQRDGSGLATLAGTQLKQAARPPQAQHQPALPGGAQEQLSHPKGSSLSWHGTAFPGGSAAIPVLPWHPSAQSSCTQTRAGWKEMPWSLAKTPPRECRDTREGPQPPAELLQQLQT